MADTFEQALIELQIELRKAGVVKDSTNPHFGNTYVSLGKLVETVLPILNDRGWVLNQWPSHIDGAPALRTRLTWVVKPSYQEDTTPLILDKTNAQGYGSALTYTRRYALLSILGLVADEDDDGEAAVKPRSNPMKGSF